MEIFEGIVLEKVLLLSIFWLVVVVGCLKCAFGCRCRFGLFQRNKHQSATANKSHRFQQLVHVASHHAKTKHRGPTELRNGHGRFQFIIRRNEFQERFAGLQTKNSRIGNEHH